MGRPRAAGLASYRSRAGRRARGKRQASQGMANNGFAMAGNGINTGRLGLPYVCGKRGRSAPRGTELGAHRRAVNRNAVDRIPRLKTQTTRAIEKR